MSEDSRPRPRNAGCRAGIVCQDRGRPRELLRCLAPSEEIGAHFRAAQVEFLKGLRALIDMRIARLSSNGRRDVRPGGVTSTAWPSGAGRHDGVARRPAEPGAALRRYNGLNLHGRRVRSEIRSQGGPHDQGRPPIRQVSPASISSCCSSGRLRRPIPERRNLAARIALLNRVRTEFLGCWSAADARAGDRLMGISPRPARESSGAHREGIVRRTADDDTVQRSGAAQDEVGVTRAGPAPTRWRERKGAMALELRTHAFARGATFRRIHV